MRECIQSAPFDRIANVYYNMTMIRYAVHLTKVQLEKLQALRDRTGLSVAEHIRRAIDEYLNKHDQGPQDQTQPNT